MPKARLSMAFETLSGGTSMGVMVPTRGGPLFRSNPTYRYPVRPAVAAGNARLRTATAAYWTMTQAQVDAWERWGRENPRTDPVTGVTYPSDPRNAFTGLACKILQLEPEATLPLDPPRGDFVRQRLRIECGVGSVERGEETGTRAAFSTPHSPLDVPHLLLTASAPLLAGRVVELMVQPLRRLLCKPQRFYKSHGFATFEAGHLTVALPLPPGAYAVAVQQVEPSTGRTAGFAPLGKVELKAPAPGERGGPG